jgi:hypothetical protein
MLRDLGVNQPLSEGFKPGQSTLFVAAHKTAITGNIRCENGCQSPINPIAAQVGPLKTGKSLSPIKPHRSVIPLGQMSELDHLRRLASCQPFPIYCQ